MSDAIVEARIDWALMNDAIEAIENAQSALASCRHHDEVCAWSFTTDVSNKATSKPLQDRFWVLDVKGRLTPRSVRHFDDDVRAEVALVLSLLRDDTYLLQRFMQHQTPDPRGRLKEDRLEVICMHGAILIHRHRTLTRFASHAEAWSVLAKDMFAYLWPARSDHQRVSDIDRLERFASSYILHRLSEFSDEARAGRFQNCLAHHEVEKIVPLPVRVIVR
jgi:hypothetical protein